MCSGRRRKQNAPSMPSKAQSDVETLFRSTRPIKSPSCMGQRLISSLYLCASPQQTTRVWLSIVALKRGSPRVVRGAPTTMSR